MVSRWKGTLEKHTRYFGKKGAMCFGKKWQDIEPFEFDKMSFWLCKACMKGIADSLSKKRVVFGYNTNRKSDLRYNLKWRRLWPSLIVF